MLLAALTGSLDRQEREALAYLMAENRVTKSAQPRNGARCCANLGTLSFLRHR
jgi:hypothetical protein